MLWICHGVVVLRSGGSDCLALEPCERRIMHTSSARSMRWIPLGSACRLRASSLSGQEDERNRHGRGYRVIITLPNLASSDNGASFGQIFTTILRGGRTESPARN